MPEEPLQLRLEQTDQRPGQFTLTCGTWQYPVTLNPEKNVAINEWLRRLHPVLMGNNDPARSRDPQDLLRTVGMWLWQALLPERAPIQEREALAHALRSGRSPLLLALPDVLLGLPWELLCDPEISDEGQFLAHRRPLLRLSDSTTPVTPIEPPLRVLLLISSPLDLGEGLRVDIESERAAVEQATRAAREEGKLHLLIEDIVTVERVQHALLHFQPHIVHYIGHGVYTAAVGGALLWEDEQGNEVSISDRHLAEIFSQRDLHAVVLHGCETGRSNARTDVRSLAGTLAHAGLPAVLAQQANFTYESSQRASEAWYTALTAGQSFAEALLVVRQALIQAERPDWAVPILQGSVASLAPLLDGTSHPGPTDPLLISVGAATDLPTPTGVFVGRHRELRALCLMLENVPGSSPVMALITGPGGVGKSTLVAQAVTRYGRTYKAALTLRCQGYQGVDLFLQQIGEFLKRLDVPGFLEHTLPDPKLSTEAKIEEAIAALNAVGPVLLVIDNLESVQNNDQTVSDETLLRLLQKLLANLRGGRILISGRYAVKDLLPQGNLAANLLHLDLEDLSPNETNQLLIRHPAYAQRSDLVREKLIEEFGGFPYIYDLLSSKAAAGDLERILYEVRKYGTEEQKQPTKKEKQREEWQKVHREVVEFATLEVIISRLSTASRTLLARLSVLQRPFPLGAMEKGLGAAQGTWQQLLDWSLLHYEPLEQTYRLHSITRRYAEDLLSKLNPPSPHARLATWYEDYADHESHALEDYQSARDLWLIAGNQQRAGELVVTKLAEILSRLGLYQELRKYFEATLNAKPQIDEDTHKERPEFQVALNEAFQQDFAKGNGLRGYIARWVVRKFIKQAEKAQIEGPQYLQAQSCAQLGAIDQMEGKYADAQKHYAESRKNFKQLGNQNGQAIMLHSLGNIAYLQGNYAEARRRYKQSLAIFKRLGILEKQTAQRSDILGKQAAVLSDLGVLASSQGHYHKALQFCKKSLTICVPLDYLDKHDQSSDWTDDISIVVYVALRVEHPKIWWVARCFCMPILAILKRQDTQDEQAAPLHLLANSAQQRYEQILAVLEQVNAQDRQAATLHLLGNIAYAQRSYSEAKQLYRWCLAISERVGNQGEQATTWHSLGNVAYSQRDYPKAQEFYGQSLTLKEERLGDQVGQAQSIGQLGMIAQKQKNYAEAQKFYTQSLDLCKRLGNKDGEATTLGQLGMLAYEQKDYKQALEHLGKAYFLFENLHSPFRGPALHCLARIRRFMDETTFTPLWQSISGGQPFPMLPNAFVENHWDNLGEESPFPLLPDGPQREQRDRVIKVVESVYMPYLTLSKLPQILSRIRKKGKRRKKS